MFNICTRKRRIGLICTILCVLAVGIAFTGVLDKKSTDASAFLESRLSNFCGNFTFGAYDGEKAEKGHLYKEDLQKTTEIIELILSSKTKKIDSITYSKIKKPFYGMMFDNTDNLECTELFFSSGYLFTDDGSFYKTDIDLSGIIDGYFSNKHTSELYAFPGIRLINIQNGKWNTEYMTEDRSFSPESIPDGIKTEMVSFIGEELIVKLVNESEQIWGFGLEDGLSVKIDDTWYYTPTKGERGVLEVLIQVMPHLEHEQTHRVPMYLPSGRYRIHTMGTVFEFDIDHDARQNKEK